MHYEAIRINKRIFADYIATKINLNIEDVLKRLEIRLLVDDGAIVESYFCPELRMFIYEDENTLLDTIVSNEGKMQVVKKDVLRFGPSHNWAYAICKLFSNSSKK